VTIHTTRYSVSLLVASLLAAPAGAELPGGPVRRDSGPISELSANVGADSGPVRGSGGSLQGRTAGALGGNSVRESVTGDVRSGPVSELSVGPVTAGEPVSGGGTVGDASAGAVMKDLASPIGERITSPLRELGPLQEALRTLQPLPRNAPGGGVQPGLDEAALWEESEVADEAERSELESRLEEAPEPPAAPEESGGDTAAEDEPPTDEEPAASSEATPPEQPEDTDQLVAEEETAEGQVPRTTPEAQP
jgi:hypothetical protein